MFFARYLFVFACVCISCVFAQTESRLPDNPKNQSQEFFVSNPDGILPAGVVADLNAISQDIEHRTGAEYAIVVMNDFGAGGRW